jgi:PKD repeat protein
MELMKSSTIFVLLGSTMILISSLGLGPGGSCEMDNDESQAMPLRGVASSTVEETTLRTVDTLITYHWYDMFNVSFGDHWQTRWEKYGEDEPISDSYPYIFRRHYDDMNYTVHSSMRLNISGSSMPCFNMNDNPQFLPLFGEERGGQAAIDWDMHYVTRDEWIARLNPMVSPYYDGWAIQLSGTTSLDRQAAKAVMNLTDEQFDNFGSWWSAYQSDFELDYIEWLEYEGRERFDIYPMYEYPLSFIIFNLDGEKRDDAIVLTYDTWSWGMEALLTRWLHHSFMPTEWFFDDVELDIAIGFESADFDMDAAVVGALTATATKTELEPCWVWQGMLQDNLPASFAHPISDFEDYAYESHARYSPGSADYGEMARYRSTPGSFDLFSGGVRLIIDMPREDQIFQRHTGPGMIENISGPMVCAYSEPMWINSPVDADLEVEEEVYRITFTGPFDFKLWSQTQSTNQNLSDEWDRLGVLPWGMPYLEFSDGSDNTPPTAQFTVNPEWGYNGQEIEFNATASHDEEDDASMLRVRWDWESDGTYDTEWTTNRTAVHTFPSPGEHNITLQVIDSRMGLDETVRDIFLEKHTPCETTAIISGSQGENDWYVSAVSIDFSAEEGSVPVNCTFYRMDEESWCQYDDALTIDTEGMTRIEFFSVDSIGLSDETQSLTIRIDMTGPTVVSTTPDTFNTGTVTATWTCSDSTSGLSHACVSLNGGPLTTCTDLGSVTLEGLSDGEYVLAVLVYDVAGNYEAVPIEFTVNDGTSGVSTSLLVIAAAAAVLASIAILVFIRRTGKS